MEVKALLINSADDINSSGWDKYTGWGYVNLQNAYSQKDFVSQQNINIENYEYDFDFYNVVLNNSNLFYYSLDLNNSEFILKDNSRDLNVLQLSLMQNPLPIILTNTITKDFNINIQDNDLNILATELTINGNNYSFNTSQDGNNYYVSGSGLGTVGTHALQIIVYDYSNNISSKTYTYTINPTVSSGGGSSGGSSSNNSEEVVENVEINIVKDKNIFEDISEIEDLGDFYFDSRTFDVVLYDENFLKIKDENVKIYDSNILLFEGNNLKDFDFTKYQGKTLQIIAYSDNNIILNRDIFIPFIQTPKYDINNESIMPFKDENLLVEEGNNNLKNYFIAFAILILITILFLLNKRYKLLP